MTLDLTKPLRLKRTGLGLRYLGTLKGNIYPIVCAFYSPHHLPKHETQAQFAEHELENVPKSRWMNVYEAHGGQWYSTRADADGAFRAIDVRIGLLEDKQDGSPFVFHDLRGK